MIGYRPEGCHGPDFRAALAAVIEERPALADKRQGAAMAEGAGSELGIGPDVHDGCFLKTVATAELPIHAGFLAVRAEPRPSWQPPQRQMSGPGPTSQLA